MFTHAKCGGVLLPIADPDWLNRPDNLWEGDWRRAFALLARCDKCRMEGEVFQKEPYDLERRRFWAGLVTP